MRSRPTTQMHIPRMHSTSPTRSSSERPAIHRLSVPTPPLLCIASTTIPPGIWQPGGDEARCLYRDTPALSILTKNGETGRSQTSQSGHVTVSQQNNYRQESTRRPLSSPTALRLLGERTLMSDCRIADTRMICADPCLFDWRGSLLLTNVRG